jgi:hypothetical protein
LFLAGVTAGAGGLRPYAVAGLAALAVAASGLVVKRRRHGRGTDQPGAPGREAGESDESGEATMRI